MMDAAAERPVRTLSIKKLSKAELRIGALLYPERHDRPTRRSDCANVPRPCPYVGCRYHLYLDVVPETGALRFNYPELEPDQLEHSCALDVAGAQGPLTLEEVGELVGGVTRERVRQIETRLFVRLREVPELAAALQDVAPEPAFQAQHFKTQHIQTMPGGTWR